MTIRHTTAAMNFANTAHSRVSDLMSKLRALGVAPEAMEEIYGLVREISEAERLRGLSEATARVADLFSFETNGRSEIEDV